MITLTYLEFYCGIGGWGYALEHACQSIIDAPTHHDVVPAVKKPKIAIQDDTDLQIRAQLLAAYDHSDLCNSVFHQNHLNHLLIDDDESDEYHGDGDGSKEHKNKKSKKKKKMIQQYKPCQRPIERLTQSELENHAATVWCMSPPCQPHTRQHSNQYKERDDPRSQSFLHLCHLLGDVMREETLPSLILLENVVGFEKDWGGDGGVDVQDGDVNVDSSGGDAKDKEKQSSKDEREKSSFQSWRKALSKRDYHVAHFHLDPTHVGLPNNRPRHYTVAFRPGALRQRLGKEDGASFFNHQHNIMGERYAPLFRKELLGKPPIIHDEKSLASQEKDGTVLPAAIPCIGSMLDTDLAPHACTSGNLSSKKHQLVQIPEKVRTSSSSWCFDIVTSQHHLSACFTHSYGKFVRGTGSILYTGPLVVGEEGKSKSASSDISLANKEEAQHCNAAMALSANTGSDNEKDATPPSIGRFELARPQERKFDASWSDDLDWDQLRYFSGNEIARIMGFPVADPPAVACDGACPGKKMLTGDHGTSTTLEAKSQETAPMFTKEEKESYRKFSFPPESTMKQQWKLLGNSLNVRVAACVAQIGIEMILNE